jgi:hypothetical protein
MLAHADEPLSREDQFIRTNKRVLLAFAGAFGVWRVGDALLGGAPSWARGPLLALTLTAALLWTILLVLMMRRGRMAQKDPVLRAALQDERARDVRMRAYRTAFWSTVGAAALLGVPAAGHSLSASVATTLVLVTGITSFFVAYVVHDRE